MSNKLQDDDIVSEYEFKQRTRSLFKMQEAYEVKDNITKEPIFMGKRDRLWFKRDLKVFQGDNDQGELFVFMKDNSIFDAWGSFTVQNINGDPLCHIKRKFWRSFFWRESWEFYNPEGILVARASADGSFIKTFIRKFKILTVIPVIGGILAALMRLQFEFVDLEGNQFATFKRKASIRDFYILRVGNRNMPVPEGALVALSMVFDSAEGR